MTTSANKLTIQLSIDDVNRLLGALGDLQIKTGLADLTMDIKNQAQAQLTPAQGQASE